MEAMQRLSFVKSWWWATTTLCSIALLLLGSSVAFADGSVTMTEGSATDINTWQFTPAEVTIAAGQSVTWTNNGTQAHTATADNGSAFDTGMVAKGDSKTITFDTPGTFTYHCTPHPWMKGTITVTAAAAAAPAAAAPAAAAPAAAAPAAAAPAVSQALPTPTPFRFLTPTPVGARPATTTTTTTTTAPKAGGIPDGLPAVVLVLGVTALLGGAQVLRRGRRPSA
jgi:plastocyanin